jgi:hypothetical protein
MTHRAGHGGERKRKEKRMKKKKKPQVTVDVLQHVLMSTLELYLLLQQMQF